jgi:hypothetical protein
VLNLAGAAAGLAGGRLAFYDRAHYDSTGLDPNFGVVQIVNTGSRVAGAGGGSVVFHDDSYARGAQLSIANKAENDGPA